MNHSRCSTRMLKASRIWVHGCRHGFMHAEFKFGDVLPLLVAAVQGNACLSTTGNPLADLGPSVELVALAGIFWLIVALKSEVEAVIPLQRPVGCICLTVELFF